MREWFRRFARAAFVLSSSPLAFIAMFVMVVIWLLAGPFAHFSDSWQLVLSSISNVVTLMLVFLIQNTQNRDARAVQLKLDELLRAIGGARTGLVDLEELSDLELQHLEEQFNRLHVWATRRARSAGGQGPGARGQ